PSSSSINDPPTQSIHTPPNSQEQLDHIGPGAGDATVTDTTSAHSSSHSTFSFNSCPSSPTTANDETQDEEPEEEQKTVYTGLGQRDDVVRGKRRDLVAMKKVGRRWVRGVGVFMREEGRREG
ncbi:MAG: hypothetical protein Q9206_006926, partial [Seirophora lacunosa]